MASTSNGRKSKRDEDGPLKGDKERDLPHDPKVERALCGALLLNPGAIVAAAPILNEYDVFGIASRAIYGAALDLYNGGLEVTITTVRNRFEATDQFKALGDEMTLMDCINECDNPSIPAAEAYAKIIADYAVRRRLVSAGGDIARVAYDHPSVEAEAKASLMLMEATTRKGGDAPQLLGDIVAEWELHDEPLLGLTTGITDLDDLTGGLHDGEIWAIAARPAVGKTAFVTQMMTHIASQQTPVLFFSLEMSKPQVLMRLLSSMARINIQAVYRNQLEPAEKEMVNEAAQKLKKLPLHIDDTGAITIEQVRARTLRLHHMGGIRLVVIDYLQLLRTEERKGTRNDDIGYISMTLMQMAKELRCPIVAVSQLSRAISHRRDKRPELTDLRDSGQIEQDAHVVCFLHTEEDDDEHFDPLHPETADVELIVAKQRNGPTGARWIGFDRTCGRFGDATVSH